MKRIIITNKHLQNLSEEKNQTSKTTISESDSFVFTKKVLNEARLAKIKKDGDVFSKKDFIKKILN
jgi:hypothetical protein